MGFVQQPQDLCSSVLIEIAGRLICEQNGGVIDKGPGNRRALTLAPRELSRAMVESMIKPKAVQ